MIDDIMNNPLKYDLAARCEEHRGNSKVAFFPMMIEDFVFNVNMSIYMHGKSTPAPKNLVIMNFRTKKLATYHDMVKYNYSEIRYGNLSDSATLEGPINPTTNLPFDWYKAYDPSIYADPTDDTNLLSNLPSSYDSEWLEDNVFDL